MPEFNKMYELYDPCTLMFFYRNKHIMIDLGTGNNNKINWPMDDEQEMIDILEVSAEAHILKRARADPFAQVPVGMTDCISSSGPVLRLLPATFVASLIWQLPACRRCIGAPARAEVLSFRPRTTVPSTATRQCDAIHERAWMDADAYTGFTIALRSSLYSPLSSFVIVGYGKVIHNIILHVVAATIHESCPPFSTCFIMYHV